MKIEDLFITQHKVLTHRSEYLLQSKSGEIYLRASGPLALQAMQQIAHLIQYQQENQNGSQDHDT